MEAGYQESDRRRKKSDFHLLPLQYCTRSSTPTAIPSGGYLAVWIDFNQAQAGAIL
jgi:hypothetical protein